MFEGYLAYPILFVAAFVAGLVDSIAGGGGLITVPALLLTGMPPQLALGTNKFQASFGSFTAAFRFCRAGEVKASKVIPGIVFTAIGAATGSILVQIINADFLTKLIPFLLLGILIYTFAKPKVGQTDGKSKISERVFYILIGLSLGFYDGFFGPGTGSFWVVAFVLLLGYNMKKATTHTKVMNFTSNIVSLLFFIIGCNIDYMAGIAMAGGQILGARMGSGLVIKKGASFIRPFFIVVVTLVMLKLFWDEYFAS